MDDIILLDEARIKNEISQTINLHVLKTVDSTQTWLKNYTACQGITFCIAEDQTDAYGRFGRKWITSSCENIYLSCLYPFNKDIHELSGLSIVLGLALVKVLLALKVPDLKIKWPNDVFYKDQKLAGCLVEIHKQSRVIMGIGLNVNCLAQDNMLQSWASLRKITGQYYDRNSLCASLIKQILKASVQFEQQGLAPFLQSWQSVDYLLGKTIAIDKLNERFEGKASGINEHGQLLLEQKNGKLLAFSSGEASVVKSAQ